MPQDIKEKTAAEAPLVIDVFGVLQRHISVLLLSVFAAWILAICYCFSSEEFFESNAQIVIDQRKAPTLTGEVAGDGLSLSQENELETHMLVLTSPMIIDRAVKANGLESCVDLVELEEDKFLRHWEEHLSVEIPESDASVISVNYRGKSPEDCQKILEGLLHTYESHLSENSSDLGVEVTKLIAQGKNDLLQQLEAAEEEYASFQKAAPLLWREGEGVAAGEQVAINIYRERQAEIEKKRKELLVEKSLLQAQIKTVALAIRRGGRERDAVYYQALVEFRSASEEDSTLSRESARGYGLELNREYMQLLAEERRMSVEFGDGHPDLVAMRSRLKEMRKAVESSLGQSLRDGVAVSSNEMTANKMEYISAFARLLTQRHAAVELQLAQLDTEFVRATKGATEIQQFMSKDKELRATIARTEKLFDAVVARLEEINIIQDYGVEKMKIIADPAMGKKVWPSIPIVMALATILGGMAGLTWAVLRDLTLRVFHSPSEIRAMLDAPVLGQVPILPKLTAKGRHSDISPTLGVVHSPKSRFSEAFRGIRTNLRYGSRISRKRVFLVTSPTPGDGKSTTSANLAASIAKSNKKVLLIDIDLRRPVQHTLFGCVGKGGLSEILRDELDVEDVIKQTSIDNLDLITAGGAVDDPAELLSSDVFDSLIDKLQLHYDVIILDSPPILAVSDPIILASRVDGVLFVLRIREKVRAATETARNMLNEVGATLLGAVVVGVDGKSNSSRYGYAYDSGYRYGYGYQGSGGYYATDKKNPVVSTHGDETNSLLESPFEVQ